MGASIDFTDEELVFAALNHDLGKIGYKGPT
jgi:predicted HD phosphohydrolase